MCACTRAGRHRHPSSERTARVLFTIESLPHSRAGALHAWQKPAPSCTSTLLHFRSAMPLSSTPHLHGQLSAYCRFHQILASACESRSPRAEVFELLPASRETHSGFVASVEASYIRSKPLSYTARRKPRTMSRTILFEYEQQQRSRDRGVVIFRALHAFLFLHE
ncbi:hypothetical protein B0H19DRAFT_1378605, partial [Mycena capillaripes]